jgi:mannitol operon transcriptional antiterminator
MSRIKITLRQKEIIKNICNEYKYVTVSSIADKLDISKRTVLRELGDIESWLNIYGCSLDKRTGIGIRLKGSDEDRKKILEALEEGKEVKTYSPKERQVIILGELLQEKEPIKLFSFTKSLNVTESTVSNDLDKVELWLQNYNLKLMRKPGLGIYIEGQEDEIRKAIVNLIYENIDEIQLLDLVREKFSKETDTRERLLNLIEKETVRKLETLIFQLEDTLGYKLADNAFIGLIVHLALAIERIKKNEKIIMDEEHLQKLRNYSEFKTAAVLTNEISKVFNIEIPEDEVGYVTMHLRGSKGLESREISEEFNFLIKEIIRLAEIETGSFLEENDQFVTGLTNHLVPAINRLKMKMDIRNPLLQEVKEYYPELYNLAAKCVEPVEKYLNMKMPDSEIAYIAMHIGAALEKKEPARKRVYRTIVSCTTGIGTSRLLATRLVKEFENIQIIEVISSLHIKESNLKEKGIDFIISTVPLEIPSFPVVVVNPLLFPKDKEKVANLIKELKTNPSRYSKETESTLNLKDKLSTLKLYTDGILQVLNNLFIYEYERLDSIEELIVEVGSKLSKDSESKAQIEKDIREREKKGTTVLTGFNSILLHCRTSGVKELYFGAVRIKNGIYCVNAEDEKEQVKLAIIMLAPENCDRLQLDIMSFISSKLIEESEFLTILAQGKKEEVNLKLNNYMDEFYRMKSS